MHDEKNRVKADLLTRFFGEDLPRPFGVFYSEERTCYEDALQAQIDQAVERKGEGDLDALLRGSNTWEIE